MPYEAAWGGPAQPTIAAMADGAARAGKPVMQVAAPMAPEKVKIPDYFVAPGKPSGDKAPAQAPKYKLLLFNDNVNRREFVARVLCNAIPDLKQADAYVIMQKAHKNGMAVVGVWVFETAEMYNDLLRTGGLISSITEAD